MRAEGTPPTSLVDCHFFLQGACTKGAECPFRHHDACLSQFKPCKFWEQGLCRNPACNFRHTTQLYNNNQRAPHAPAHPFANRTACHFFAQGRCTKGQHCPFLHSPQPPQVVVVHPALHPQALRALQFAVTAHAAAGGDSETPWPEPGAVGGGGVGADGGGGGAVPAFELVPLAAAGRQQAKGVGPNGGMVGGPHLGNKRRQLEDSGGEGSWSPPLPATMPLAHDVHGSPLKKARVDTPAQQAPPLSPLFGQQQQQQRQQQPQQQQRQQQPSLASVPRGFVPQPVSPPQQQPPRCGGFAPKADEGRSEERREQRALVDRQKALGASGNELEKGARRERAARRRAEQESAVREDTPNAPDERSDKKKKKRGRGRNQGQGQQQDVQPSPQPQPRLQPQPPQQQQEQEKEGIGRRKRQLNNQQPEKAMQHQDFAVRSFEEVMAEKQACLALGRTQRQRQTPPPSAAARQAPQPTPRRRITRQVPGLDRQDAPSPTAPPVTARPRIVRMRAPEMPASSLVVPDVHQQKEEKVEGSAGQQEHDAEARSHLFEDDETDKELDRLLGLI